MKKVIIAVMVAASVAGAFELGRTTGTKSAPQEVAKCFKSPEHGVIQVEPAPFTLLTRISDGATQIVPMPPEMILEREEPVTCPSAAPQGE